MIKIALHFILVYQITLEIMLKLQIIYYFKHVI